MLFKAFSKTTVSFSELSESQKPKRDAQVYLACIFRLVSFESDTKRSISRCCNLAATEMFEQLLKSKWMGMVTEK